MHRRSITGYIHSSVSYKYIQSSRIRPSVGYTHPSAFVVARGHPGYTPGFYRYMGVDAGLGVADCCCCSSNIPRQLHPPVDHIPSSVCGRQGTPWTHPQVSWVERQGSSFGINLSFGLSGRSRLCHMHSEFQWHSHVSLSHACVTSIDHAGRVFSDADWP